MTAKIVTLWYLGAPGVLNTLTDTVGTSNTKYSLDEKLRSNNIVVIPYKPIEGLVKLSCWRPVCQG